MKQLFLALMYIITNIFHFMFAVMNLLLHHLHLRRLSLRQ